MHRTLAVLLLVLTLFSISCPASQKRPWGVKIKACREPLSGRAKSRAGALDTSSFLRFGSLRYNMESLQVIYQNKVITFRANSGFILFKLLAVPGAIVPEKELWINQSGPSPVYQLRLLIRIFRDINPRFNLFRIKPAKGYYIVGNEEDEQEEATLLDHIERDDLILKWFDGKLRIRGGPTIRVPGLSTELLRVLLLAEERTVSFQTAYDAIHPGLEWWDVEDRIKRDIDVAKYALRGSPLQIIVDGPKKLISLRPRVSGTDQLGSEIDPQQKAADAKR
jgi:hypothetical protein